MKIRILALAIVVPAVLAGWALTASAGGKNENPGVLPPWSHAFGTTYAELTAMWWQWALEVPVDQCPIEDPDGRYAANGQEGKVWLLAGTSGWEAERTVTVPAGKAIFFPIVNNIWVTIPESEKYSPGDPPFSVPGAEQIARNAIIPVVDTLECEVDGKALVISEDYRIQSPVFTAYMPIDVWGFAPYIVDAGLYPDCVSDGYWILLAPLSKGKHTIHFRGGLGNTENPWFVEVTFHLTVK